MGYVTLVRWRVFEEETDCVGRIDISCSQVRPPDQSEKAAKRRLRPFRARPVARRDEGLNVGLDGNTHIGVSKNSGTPKWMIYNGNPY